MGEAPITEGIEFITEHPVTHKPFTEEGAVGFAATLNAQTPSDLKELAILVAAREKETGKSGVMLLWNEEALDKRLQFLKGNLDGSEDGYRGMVADVLEFARVRRLAWEKEKGKYEILLPSRQ